MSRTQTRILSGFATSVFVGFGAALVAPAAAADAEGEGSLTTLDTLDTNEFSYSCETTDGLDSDDEATGTFAFAAPETAETGQSIEVVGDGSSTVFFWPDEEVAAGGATLTVEYELHGDAAPQDSVSFTSTNGAAFLPSDADAFGVDGEWTEIEPVTLALSRPGAIEYVPGTVTYELGQASGASTTVCTPQEEVSAIASTEVSGDPLGDDGDGGDGDEDDAEDHNGSDEDNNADGDEGDDGKDEEDDTGEGDGDEQGKPEDGKEEADGGGLPVTGAALGGLVAAAVAALGGGGAAMYFSRRRPSRAESEDA